MSYARNPIMAGLQVQGFSNFHGQPPSPKNTIANDYNICYHKMVKTKHRKTLVDLFTKPTTAGIRFSDIEGLIVALGGEVREGSGSRVALRLGDAVKHAHRPHPGKEAKKYQVEEIRAWLEQQGVTP